MKQKHILVLFTDQQRYDTIGALGNDRIQTPNLDALVRDSVAFEHCTTPSPVCVPARLSMLSGQYPARTGCNNNNAENNYDGEGFYARLTESGYQSCCVGKMHHLPDPYGPLGFEKRWTQEELSELSTVPLSTIRAYERKAKDIKKAQADILLRLSSVLKCNMQDLLA